MLTWLAVGTGVTLLAVGIHTVLGPHRASRQYVLGRRADPERWRNLYPRQSSAVVEEALRTITSAFLLKSDDAARLLPDDRLLDVYRAAYPSRQTPDALELETLLKAIRRLPGQAGTALELPDMTVGEVVALWVSASQDTPSRRSVGLG